ncbi:MAG: hypothetical protein R2769_06155 [Saprospiraceae bacterium]
MACTEKIKPEEKPNLNFQKDEAVIPENDSLISGSTYLALYSLFINTVMPIPMILQLPSAFEISSTDTVF